MKEIKTDFQRVVVTLAGYGGAFCFAMAMLTVCLGVLTKEPIYTFWSLGLVLAGCFLWAAFLVERIQGWFDE